MRQSPVPDLKVTIMSRLERVIDQSLPYTLNPEPVISHPRTLNHNLPQTLEP